MCEIKLNVIKQFKWTVHGHFTFTSWRRSVGHVELSHCALHTNRIFMNITWIVQIFLWINLFTSSWKNNACSLINVPFKGFISHYAHGQAPCNDVCFRLKTTRIRRIWASAWGSWVNRAAAGWGRPRLTMPRKLASPNPCRYDYRITWSIWTHWFRTCTY